MHDTYQPPARSTAPPYALTGGRRILVWVVFLYVAISAIGFLSGLTMARWDLYGATMDEAIANARLVRRIVVGVVVSELRILALHDGNHVLVRLEAAVD